MVSRRRVVEALSQMIEDGASMSKIAQTLAAYLVENKQTRLVELYIRDLRAQLERRFGLASAEVQSVEKLSTSTVEDVEKYLKQQTGAREVEVINTINPDLVAGVVISTTDAEVDMSLRNKIKKLRSV